MWMQQVFTNGFSLLSLALSVISFVELWRLLRGLRETSENLGKNMRDTVRSLETRRGA